MERAVPPAQVMPSKRPMPALRRQSIPRPAAHPPLWRRMLRLAFPLPPIADPKCPFRISHQVSEVDKAPFLLVMDRGRPRLIVTSDGRLSGIKPELDYALPLTRKAIGKVLLFAPLEAGDGTSIVSILCNNQVALTRLHDFPYMTTRTGVYFSERVIALCPIKDAKVVVCLFENGCRFLPFETHPLVASDLKMVKGATCVTTAGDAALIGTHQGEIWAAFNDERKSSLRFSAGKESLTALHFSKGRLYCGDASGALCVWSYDHIMPDKSVRTARQAVTCLDLLQIQNHKILLCGHGDGMITVHNAQTLELMRSLIHPEIRSVRKLKSYVKAGKPYLAVQTAKSLVILEFAHPERKVISIAQKARL